MVRVFHPKSPQFRVGLQLQFHGSGADLTEFPRFQERMGMTRKMHEKIQERVDRLTVELDEKEKGLSAFGSLALCFVARFLGSLNVNWLHPLLIRCVGMLCVRRFLCPIPAAWLRSAYSGAVVVVAEAVAMRAQLESVNERLRCVSAFIAFRPSPMCSFCRLLQI